MKYLTGVYLLLFLLLFANHTYSQVNIDSLLTVWKNEKLPDSTRLAAIDQVAWSGYLFSKPDSAFFYAQIQYDFASQTGNKKQMGNALNTQAVSYSRRGEYPLSLEIHARSLEIRQEIDDQHGIAKTYMNMGPVYSNQGDKIQALNAYQKSLAISEPNNFERLISVSLNNIGVIYNSQNDYTKALEYFLRGLNLAKENNDRRVEANAISNISITYQKLGDLDSALIFANNGLELFEELGSLNGTANAYHSIGSIYYIKNEYRKALTFQSKAQKILETINDRNGAASNMVSLGLTYLQMEQPKQGENWCKKGLEMATSIGSLEYKKSACECLYEVYQKKGDFRKSLEYYIQFKQYDDNLKSQDTKKKLQQMEFAKQIVRDSITRDIKKREAEIVVADKIYRRNSLQYTGIFIVLFLLISWWFFARNLNLPKWVIELSLFVPFLVFFRFLTLLLAPYTGNITSDEPFDQLLFSLVLAAIITPTHNFFDRKVREKIFNKKSIDIVE